MEILEKIIEATLSDMPIERVIIAALLLWLFWQQRYSNRIQSKRVDDAMKLAEAAHTFSAALNRNTDALQAFVLEDQDGF